MQGYVTTTGTQSVEKEGQDCTLSLKKKLKYFIYSPIWKYEGFQQSKKSFQDSIAPYLVTELWNVLAVIIYNIITTTTYCKIQYNKAIY